NHCKSRWKIAETHWGEMPIRRPVFAAAFLLAVLSPLMARATIINGITLTGQNIFRDFRGVNDVGIAAGDQLQFGGDIGGGSAGFSGAGIFTPTGSITPTIIQSLSPCGPLSVDPNFCARSTPFTTAK